MVNGNDPPYACDWRMSTGPSRSLFFPAELVLDVGQPLVGDDTEGDEHHDERVRGGDHRLTPRVRCADRAALAVGDHERVSAGDEEREQKRLVHAGPLQDIDRKHVAVVFRVAVRVCVTRPSCGS